LEAGKERQDLRQALLMIDVLDLRAEPGRIGGDIVLQRHRNVDQASGHRVLPWISSAPGLRTLPTITESRFVGVRLYDSACRDSGIRRTGVRGVHDRRRRHSISLGYSWTRA